MRAGEPGASMLPVTSAPAPFPQPVALVVDDEPENLAMLARALRIDMQIHVAKSAEEARTILSKTRVDIIVSDERLPGEAGSSLLRDVGEREPRIGRILVTAYGDTQSALEAIRDGAIERFLLKPYEPDQLRSAVFGLLRARGLGEKPRVIVVDADSGARASIRKYLEARRIEVDEAADGEGAIEALRQNIYDAAVVDANMPRASSFDVLKKAESCALAVPVIFVSADTSNVGISLLAAGAFDYLAKPVRDQELVLRVERALASSRLNRERRNLMEKLAASNTSANIVVRSPALRKALEVARNVSRHDISVLVTGETGSGKEVMARYIHDSSRRAQGPFVTVNCGAIPDQLVESTLFGHERGAFTDAKERRAGLFEAANSGTIFLDEIGELSMAAQVRLLRVLESHEVMRVGATTTVKVDIRVIAATHRDLEAMVEQRTFRQDLYFRLSAVTVRVPPLRERKEDIPGLIEMALVSFATRTHTQVPRLTSAALDHALQYDWPGNVRELLHVIDRTIIACSGDTISELDIRLPKQTAPAPTFEDTGVTIDDSRPLREVIEPIMEGVERRYLEQVLTRLDGNIGRAAEHAGIHRKSLYNKMRRYGLSTRGRS